MERLQADLQDISGPVPEHHNMAHITVKRDTQKSGFPNTFKGGSDDKASANKTGDWVRSLGQEEPLEKAMAPHSSTLAWKIPWTEEPGRLQSMGSQRVGHD